MCNRIALFFFAVLSAAGASRPIALLAHNPHYFEFRGRPTVLITSGEHYGAVINLDFDYVRYLKTLAADRLNLTRTFVGSYLENQGAFRITGNTLAPARGRFLCPWQRSNEPGAADGLNKWDLTKWNDAYFKRLTDFVAEAGRRGIVVEINLFTPMYEQVLWDINPMNAKNNVNGAGDVQRTEALTLKDSRLVAAQDAMVSKIVGTLRDFDNVYYEICNEPYFGGVTAEWQDHVAQTIRDTEKGLAQHLISQNIANGSQKVEGPNSLVSIFNFHYSRPPESVAMNYDLRRVIGNNETGFDGTSDAVYRTQGWDFILAGGGLFNNLDHSFTAGHEDGTFAVPPTQPGGGSPALRRQYSILREFMDQLPLEHLRPAPELVKKLSPESASARLLSDPGRVYALYIHHGRVVPVDAKTKKYTVDSRPQQARVVLELPPGRLTATWLNTKTGKIEKKDSFRHEGGERELESPPYTEDVALRVSR